MAPVDRRRFNGSPQLEWRGGGPVRSDGGPHLVPIVFVLVDDVVWSAVDGKPKSTRALRRLGNIRSDPRVSLLVDHYGDDWSQLWWVRLDGLARVVDLHAPQDPATATRLSTPPRLRRR